MRAPIADEGNDAAIQSLASNGAALVMCKGETPDQWTASVAKLMQPIARQIRIFADRPDWRTIGVDTTKAADRSEGMGESPLHMDFVNAELPPDYVVLLCIRTDPSGGGHSTLAPLETAISRISEEERKHLQVRQFSDGRVEGLENIGKDANPFAILDPSGPFKLRFTAQLLKREYSSVTQAAIRHFHSELESEKTTFLIPNGHALIINQHLLAHGKAALGKGQELLPTTQRRLLLHGFFRSTH